MNTKFAIATLIGSAMGSGLSSKGLAVGNHANDKSGNDQKFLNYASKYNKDVRDAATF